MITECAKGRVFVLVTLLHESEHVKSEDSPLSGNTEFEMRRDDRHDSM